MSSIRNIIFDYGGVIIDLDYSLTKAAFEKAGLKNFDTYWTQLHQTSLFDDFDRGTIPVSEFRKKLNEEVGLSLPDDVIDHAWNAMLGGIKNEKWVLLERLKKNYRLFLLSNTNEIHLLAISDYLQKTFGMKSPDSFFEKVYYSCDIGMRKPDPEIFNFVIRENHLIPSETLYIDDSIQHVEAAEKAGLISKLYEGKKPLAEFVDELIST